MRLFAAALALTLGLAGCGPVDGDPIRSGASAPDSVPQQDAVTVAQLRQQAEQPWQFVTDIPADHRVTAPGGGRELYCIFAVRREDTLFVYEKQDPQYPHQTGRELYCKQDGQPILLLCNGSREDTDTMVTVYCSTGRPLDWNPQLSGSTGRPMPVEGVADFSLDPEPQDAPAPPEPRG